MIVPFRRTLWTASSHPSDQSNFIWFWQGPAMAVARIYLTIERANEIIDSFRIRAHAQVSSDGESWSDVSWSSASPGSAPGGVDELTGTGFDRVGPYDIAPHDKPLIRVGLEFEPDSAEPLVAAYVEGHIELIPDSADA